MSKNKKQPIPTRKKVDVTLKWEELLGARDMTVSAIVSQQTQLHALTIKHKDDLLNNPELSKVVAGLALTYKDVADACRATMDKHMTLDSDNKILDYKKGIVNQDSDEFFDFLNISREYISQAENVATYASVAFTDIFAQLKTYDMTKFQEEIELGKKEMEKIKLGAINGK